MAITFTEDQFLEPLWRISNLYTVVNKEGDRVQFIPNSSQLHLLENMHNRNLILKARQIGFTTLMAIVQLDACLFTPDTRAAIIAHKLDDAKLIFKDKVKFAYDCIDDGLKAALIPNKDSADTLSFNNNSSLRVSTSTRSGTVNWLHVSEYGKICATNPDRAREIKTGAFPSAEKGIITIESTAEGQAGDFFEKAQSSESLANQGVELNRFDYKFFFFPWFEEETYTLPVQSATHLPDKDDKKYFARIESEVQTQLTEEQRLWWLSQSHEYGGDMKREYPSTPKEAFEQAVEGAFFADQIALAEKRGRIGNFPIDPGVPVNTYWDLGRNDLNVIWLEQDQGGLSVFVGCYVNQGEWIGHYVQWLEDFKNQHGIIFGSHNLPHDGDRKDIWNENGTMDTMYNLGFQPDIVERSPNKLESIQRGRRVFSRCAFDATECKVGISHLKRFRKKFNNQLGVWSNSIEHDDASHYGDAFLTFADSGHVPEIIRGDEFKRDRYRNDGNNSNLSHMSA